MITTHLEEKTQILPVSEVLKMIALLGLFLVFLARIKAAEQCSRYENFQIISSGKCLTFDLMKHDVYEIK